MNTDIIWQIIQAGRLRSTLESLTHQVERRFIWSGTSIIWALYKLNMFSGTGLLSVWARLESSLKLEPASMVWQLRQPQLVGMKCDVYMGCRGCRRQRLNVSYGNDGGDCSRCGNRHQNPQRWIDAAFGADGDLEAFYVLGSLSVHPYRRLFMNSKVISEESRRRIWTGGRLPDYVCRWWIQCYRCFLSVCGRMKEVKLVGLKPPGVVWYRPAGDMTKEVSGSGQYEDLRCLSEDVRWHRLLDFSRLGLSGLVHRHAFFKILVE